MTPPRWSLALLLLVFLIAGFVAGAAFFAIVGPGRLSLDPVVQTVLVTVIGAVVAAAAAGGGILVGQQLASIDAAANREEMRAAREAEREDARQARSAEQEVASSAEFGDRIRDLAAQFVIGTRDAVTAVVDDQARKRAGMARPAYTRDLQFYAAGLELRLLVRRRETYMQIDRLTRLVSDLEQHTGEGEPVEIRKFAAELEPLGKAYDEFEDAIRAEIGAPPLPAGTRMQTSFGDTDAHRSQ